jgi:hypothetical protein
MLAGRIGCAAKSLHPTANIVGPDGFITLMFSGQCALFTAAPRDKGEWPHHCLRTPGRWMSSHTRSKHDKDVRELLLHEKSVKCRRIPCRALTFANGQIKAEPASM